MAALAVPTHHPGDVGRRSWLSIALVIASAALAPLAAGGGAGTAATLDLSAVLRIDSIRGNACPPGSPLTLACPARTGAGAVRGLGARHLGVAVPLARADAGRLCERLGQDPVVPSALGRRR